MEITLNRFAKYYLEELKVTCSFNNSSVSRFKEGQKLFIPDSGYMEEYSTTIGSVLCQMGSHSYSNASLPSSKIKMGRYNSIAFGLRFMAEKHPLHTITTSSCFYDPYFSIFKDSFLSNTNREYDFCKDWSFYSKLVPPPSETILENDVYVCTNAIIKPGITLHTGCVVAQNAIVTKDVPPYAIVGGAPARILKYRFSQEIIERLLKLKWWEYHFSLFSDLDFMGSIEEFIDKLESKIEVSQKFNPRKMYFEELIQRSKTNKSYELNIDSIGAVFQVRNSLEYQLGYYFIESARGLKNFLSIPKKLRKVRKDFKEQQKIYKEKIKLNPSLEYKKAHLCSDYNDSLKIKHSFCYELGVCIIKARKTWFLGGHIWLLIKYRILKSKAKKGLIQVY